MSGSDRDLVAALRAELAAIDPARACDRQAEIAGLGARIHAREPAVARLVVRLGGHAREGAGVSRRTFLLPEADLRLGLPRPTTAASPGCAAGSSLAARSALRPAAAHLEFTVPAEDARQLATRLADVGLPASWRLRRGQGVVTWKSTESITAFLGRIGGSAALLELEARSVARTLRGELNRVLNAESANLQRSVEAAGRQLAAIDTLEADGRLATQPRTVRAVAEARRETPEASLSDIAARLELHRSTVQRALDRRGAPRAPRRRGRSGCATGGHPARVRGASTAGGLRAARRVPGGRSAVGRAAALWHHCGHEPPDRDCRQLEDEHHPRRCR